MVNGEKKNWARFSIDRDYLQLVQSLKIIPIHDNKQCTEVLRLQDRNYVEKALERIMKRYENVFDRVEYVNCFAPLGRNYWTKWSEL